jgi:outer membrane protein assembly factor BamB
VYIQTGNHSGDTFLHAFDADTGNYVFKSPHSAQWERYAAPTIYDGSVYINGGYYGGMYGFNAFSGEKMWFKSLPQRDGWTPAVEGDHSYAFVKGTLYAIDRHYGTQDFTIKAGLSTSTKVPVKGSYNNILVVNGSVLYSLDLLNKEIKWEIQGSYSGIPSVSEGIIYVVNEGRLEVRDEATGDFLWSWTAPEGSLKSPVIVTETHVIACTSENTYTIEILGRDLDWSYPASGHLSLGNDTLYIAQDDGVLTAIATPEYIPAIPVKLEIVGPNDIFESSTNAYEATVYYNDGRIRNRTALCNWTLTGTPLVAIDHGSLSVGELLYPQETVTLHAEYTQDETTVSDEKEITIHISGTVCELITRNLEGALKLKQQMLLDVVNALARERACADIIKASRHSLSDIDNPALNFSWNQINLEDLCDINNADLNQSWNQINLAIIRENAVESDLEKSIVNLSRALEIFSSESAYLEDMEQFMIMLKSIDYEPSLNTDINSNDE